jgi:hypothetical protein
MFTEMDVRRLVEAAYDASVDSNRWASCFDRRTMAGFARLESKPTVYPGPNGPAAMFHDFDNARKPFWNWTKHL